MTEQYILPEEDRKKFDTVCDKNTFYYFDTEFEEKHESHLHSMKETLLYFKNEIDNNGLTNTVIEKLLLKENGLRAILTLTGFSREYLKRLITVIRILNNEELNKLTYRNNWSEKPNNNKISEWGSDKILRMIKNDVYFRKGIVNIFLEGSTNEILNKTLPLFELKKLSISKLKFEFDAILDTLVRYKEKGSRAGKKKNNPETEIGKVLDELDIPYTNGDIDKLKDMEPNSKRTMDFIIPNAHKPQIVIESTYLVTTSSGEGDKSKTEIEIKKLLTKYYPKAMFIGFVDGIGWYVRKGDLSRMTSAFDDVFTLHPEEMERFKNFIKSTYKKDIE